MPPDDVNVFAWARSHRQPQLIVVSPCTPELCNACPWRLQNQLHPPEDSTPAYYTVETRTKMWRSWAGGLGLGDGTPMFCHKGAPLEAPGRLRDDATPHWCTGGTALQQRAVLRWWSSRLDFYALGPLKSAAAALEVIAEMLGADSSAIDAHWRFDGAEITLEQLLKASHPAVLDPIVGSEQVEPPTAAEIGAWSEHVPSEWRPRARPEWRQFLA
jgi:hypothetical protein